VRWVKKIFFFWRTLSGEEMQEKTMPIAQPICILGFALLVGLVALLTAPKWTKWVVAIYRKLKAAAKKGNDTLDHGLK